MIDDETGTAATCSRKLAAAESAVHSISALMLQNHLETCVVEQIRRGNVEVVDEVNAAHEEVLAINRGGRAKDGRDVSRETSVRFAAGASMDVHEGA